MTIPAFTSHLRGGEGKQILRNTWSNGSFPAKHHGQGSHWQSEAKGKHHVHLIDNGAERAFYKKESDNHTTDTRASIRDSRTDRESRSTQGNRGKCHRQSDARVSITFTSSTTARNAPSTGGPDQRIPRTNTPCLGKSTSPARKKDFPNRAFTLTTLQYYEAKSA